MVRKIIRENKKGWLRTRTELSVHLFEAPLRQCVSQS